ncbi:MAG TPA: UbiA family prenyltransferase [Candidatus Limnocylindrales bacterium]
MAHPFPSFLDACLTASLALLAGANPARSAALGLAMLALQATIGTVNDLHDAPLDRLAKPGKPIPAGLVGVGAARGAAFGASAAGLVLSALLGPATFAIGVAGLAVGLLYDLRLKGTLLSWLPFAIGVPLLPLYAWLGAAGCLPPALGLVAVLAVPAGASLALSNALADLEADRLAGLASLPVVGGGRTSWLVAVVLAAVVLAGVGLARPVSTAPLADVVLVAGGAAVVLGLGLARGPEPVRREWGWELEAVGFGLVALGWLASVAASGAIHC